MQGDFFVGYLPATATMKRFLVIAASLIVLGVLAVGVVLARAQSPFARSYFAFGDVKDYEGIVLERPEPALLSTASDGRQISILLVARGKHGAGPLIAGMHGQAVRLKGELIHRDEGAMLQVQPGSITRTGTTVAIPQPTQPHALTVRGEAVDLKCYLGTMNPGAGKLHRDCAALCTRGDVPMGLITSNGSLFVLNAERGLLRRLTRHMGEPRTSVTGDSYDISGQHYIDVSAVAFE